MSGGGEQMVLKGFGGGRIEGSWVGGWLPWGNTSQLVWGFVDTGEGPARAAWEGSWETPPHPTPLVSAGGG